MTSALIHLIDHARVFAAYCHEAARRCGGRVLGITPPGVTPNFHTAVIIRAEHRLAVLGHAHLPLAAIAEAPAAGSVTFTEDRALQDAVASVSTFRLVTGVQLETPVALVDLSALDRAERDQIVHWKPETVGELLFNHWD